ncbi:hypothetical protein HDU86_001858 [Geranomyces michiganensis]|nr:hypothetical protein HDU86_001858 [Geranomyces michiganensis]
MSAHYMPPLYPPHHLLPYWHQPPGFHPMYAAAPHFFSYPRMPLQMPCGLSHRPPLPPSPPPSESTLLRNCIPPAADAYSCPDSLSRYPPAAFAVYAADDCAAAAGNGEQAEEMPRQLTLADSCNGVKTYVNPRTNKYYAFCRQSDTAPPTFLPALSRILYNTSMPAGINVIVEDPEAKNRKRQQPLTQGSSRRTAVAAADRRPAAKPQPPVYGKRKRGGALSGRCDCAECGIAAERPIKMVRVGSGC